jgi:hypothetical protein
MFDGNNDIMLNELIKKNKYLEEKNMGLKNKLVYESKKINSI